MKARLTNLYGTKSGRLVTPPSSTYLRGRVEIKRPGEQTGAHVTEGKEELLIVLQGAATVELGGRMVRRLIVGPGCSLFIPEGTVHNVRNTGRRELRYLYVRSISALEKQR